MICFNVLFECLDVQLPRFTIKIGQGARLTSNMSQQMFITFQKSSKNLYSSYTHKIVKSP